MYRLILRVALLALLSAIVAACGTRPRQTVDTARMFDIRGVGVTANGGVPAGVINAIERQIEAERELGAACPVLEALKDWLRATNYVDAWGPRDRLRKLGYAWMRAEGERNDLYDRLRARAKRWKRLAKKQRAEAWNAHFDQALADSREIVALRLRAMAWKRLAQRLRRRS